MFEYIFFWLKFLENFFKFDELEFDESNQLRRFPLEKVFPFPIPHYLVSIRDNKIEMILLMQIRS